jgi:hypothetical protein
VAVVTVRSPWTLTAYRRISATVSGRFCMVLSIEVTFDRIYLLVGA